MASKEIRILAAPKRLEVRKTSNGQTIAGVAVRYSATSDDLGGFVEQIAPGAFSASLRGQDVLCLFNHDEGQVLGRKSAGTLTLRDTTAALEFECRLPNTTTGNDVAALCARGDLKGMSFGFVVSEDDWEQQGQQIVRTVKQAELFEVSVVAFPAYSQSTVNLRSCPAGIRCKLTASHDETDEYDAMADAAREDALRWRLLTQQRMKHI